MAHVNEFDTRSKDPLRGVQTDARKLKFNNIQSCIALVLCVYNPDGLSINKLVGVHINIINLSNSELELNIALSQIKQGNRALLDIYLIGPYDSFYATSKLAEKLKYLNPRSINLANLKPPTATGGANKDVKVEVLGTAVHAYYRDCVKIEYGTVKDHYDPAKGGTKFTNADFKAGKHQFVNDRADKPWQLIAGFRALPVV